MNSDVPKQFLLLAGKPVLMHSIAAFHAYDPAVKIIVALNPALFAQWESLCTRHCFSTPHQLAPGGSVRFESVKNSLSLVTADGLVAIHDGVRPLLSTDLISRTYDLAYTAGNAIPFSSPADSVRIIEGEANSPLDRSKLRLIQTPQVFRVSLIRKAYELAGSGQFTDDACVLEAAGGTINLIRGEQYNIKITWPEDLLIAESLLR